MTDVVEQAQEREAFDREQALKEHLDRVGPLFDGDTDCATAMVCFECEAPIPEERRRAVPGAMLCVECQAVHERRERQYA